MGLKRPIDITAEQRKTLLALLERHLPDTTAWVYGSRVKWTARPESDLDLVVFATPAQEHRVSDLRDAFEDSSLPFRVDLFVWDGIPEQFRERIEREHVVLVEKEERGEVDGWRTITLGEVLTLQRGFDLPTAKRESGSYPVIASTGLVGTHNTAAVKGPGVVIGRSGSLGGGQFIEDDFWPLNTTLWVKDFKNNDPKFCYFLLRSLDFGRFNAGSGVPTLNRNHIHPLPVSIPPLPEQRAIAHILGTLDDKIELNRRMNETLEAMARALFKSWFVDFDPVRARMEGRYTGLPKHIADLFPDRLVESELGKIPEGWEVGTVRQLAKRIQNGGTPKRSEPAYWEHGEIPWLTSGEIRQSLILGTQNFISEEGLAKSSAKIVPARSILVALYGATAGQVSMNYQSLSTNQAISAIIPSTGNRYFCLMSLKMEVSELENRAVGSAQQNISKKIVEDTMILLPCFELRSTYDALMKPLFDQNFHNLYENQTLSTLRDMLLPKLISGELRVRKTSQDISLDI